MAKKTLKQQTAEIIFDVIDGAGGINKEVSEQAAELVINNIKSFLDNYLTHILTELEEECDEE